MQYIKRNKKCVPQCLGHNFFLELRPEVKVTVTRKTVCINTPNLVYSYISNDTIFPDLRLEVKVTGTQKQYVTLHDPKMYPHTKFGIPTSNNIRDMLQLQCPRIEARGQGHSYLEASVTSHYHKMYPYAYIYGILTSNNIGYALDKIVIEPWPEVKVTMIWKQ